MINELMTHVWQSTLFAIAAGLLTLAFRKNRAMVRFALWLSTSLKFFIPFAFLMSLGSHLEWTRAAHQIATQIATPAVSFAVEYVAQPFSAALLSVPVAPHRTDWIRIALIAAWACGFLAIALIRLRLWLRVRAVVRASVALEIPATVEIRESAGLLEPGVVGLLNPVLLLPVGITELLTPPQLEAVLAHELCHVRRRDNLFAAIHMIVEAIFWFHPLVWWIGARLVDERERACDEEVLSLGNQPRIYADAILNVCKLYTESPLVCVSGVTGANIRRRIEAIMTNRSVLTLNRAKKVLLASAGFAAVAGPVAVGIVIGLGHIPEIHAQSPVAAHPVVAQTAPAEPVRTVKTQAPAAMPPEFDAASIKPFKPGAGGRGGRSSGGLPPPSGGRLQITSGRVISSPEGATARRILLDAYHLMNYQLSGGPAWLDSDVFQLEAKAADASADENQLRLMLQTLLRKRFQLVMHREIREMPVYALAVGKNGTRFPVLKATDEEAVHAAMLAAWKKGADEVTIAPMAEFVDQMNARREKLGIDRPVVDKTGILGTHLFALRLAAGEDYKTAVEEQLGLKFEPQKAPVNIFVIDKIEKPYPN